MVFLFFIFLYIYIIWLYIGIPGSSVKKTLFNPIDVHSKDDVMKLKNGWEIKTTPTALMISNGNTVVATFDTNSGGNISATNINDMKKRMDNGGPFGYSANCQDMGNRTGKGQVSFGVDGGYGSVLWAGYRDSNGTYNCNQLATK